MKFKAVCFLRSSKLVIIERLLLLAERYVITIEVRANTLVHKHSNHTHSKIQTQVCSCAEPPTSPALLFINRQSQQRKQQTVKDCCSITGRQTLLINFGNALCRCQTRSCRLMKFDHFAIAPAVHFSTESHVI